MNYNYALSNPALPSLHAFYFHLWQILTGKGSSHLFIQVSRLATVIEREHSTKELNEQSPRSSINLAKVTAISTKLTSTDIATDNMGRVTLLFLLQ